MMNETVYLFALSLPNLLDRIVADKDEVRVPVPPPPSPDPRGSEALWKQIVATRIVVQRSSEPFSRKSFTEARTFVTIDGLRDSLQVSPEAASRIVERLVSAGLLIEASRGVWTRVCPLSILKTPFRKFLTPTLWSFAAPADRYSVGVVVLSAVFLLTVAIGAAVAKGVLTLVLSLVIEGQLPAVTSVRAIAAGLDRPRALVHTKSHVAVQGPRSIKLRRASSWQLVPCDTATSSSIDLADARRT